jgi:hypothetical protein
MPEWPRKQAPPEYIKTRQDYANDYDKTAKPYFEAALRMDASAVEYAKLAISYLFLVNAGGLGAIVAVYPLVRDTNQLWLQSALWPACLFGFGLMLATSCAAAAYSNLVHNSDAAVQLAVYQETVLKTWYFGQKHELDADEQRLRKKTRLARAITKMGLTLALTSMFCGVAGGLILIWSLYPRMA